jgi:biotin-(acetyl-CoA carboxylase) ligase
MAKRCFDQERKDCWHPGGIIMAGREFAGFSAGHTKDNINPVETLVYLIKTIIKIRESILSPIFIQQYENSLAYKHQLITLDAGKGKIHSGTLRGIDRQGRIIIQITDGSEQVFPIGDVKLRPQ